MMGYSWAVKGVLSPLWPAFSHQRAAFSFFIHPHPGRLPVHFDRRSKVFRLRTQGEGTNRVWLLSLFLPETNRHQQLDFGFIGHYHPPAFVSIKFYRNGLLYNYGSQIQI